MLSSIFGLGEASNRPASIDTKAPPRRPPKTQGLAGVVHSPTVSYSSNPTCTVGGGGGGGGSPLAKKITSHDDCNGLNAHNQPINGLSHGHIGAFGLLEESCSRELRLMGVEVHVEGEEAPLYNL